MIKKIKEIFVTIFNTLTNKKDLNNLLWYISDFIHVVLASITYYTFVFGTKYNYFYLVSECGMSALSLCALDLLAGLFFALILHELSNEGRFYRNEIKSKNIYKMNIFFAIAVPLLFSFFLIFPMKMIHVPIFFYFAPLWYFKKVGLLYYITPMDFIMLYYRLVKFIFYLAFVYFVKYLYDEYEYEEYDKMLREWDKEHFKKLKESEKKESEKK